MADIKETLKGLDLDEIERIHEQLNKFSASAKKLGEEQLFITQSQAKALLENKDVIESLVKSNGAELQNLITETQKINSKAAKERVKELQEIQKHVKKNQTSFKTTVKDYSAGSSKLNKVLLETAKNAQSVSKRMMEAAKEARKAGKEAAEIKFDIKDIPNAAAGISNAIAGIMTTIKTETLIVMGLMRGLNFRALNMSIKAMISAVDTDFRAVIKQGTQDTARLNQTFVASIDPIYAVRRGFVDLAQGSKMLKNVGITTRDASAALVSLKNNAMSFRDGLEDTYPGITAYTTNLVAGMKKIGIATEQSTKSIDTFTKALKETPMQATRSIKRLINIADSLDINVSKAISDFNSNINTFIQYGDQAVEVFAGLEKQALATGIGISQLSKAADKLNTFKGAASTVQGLNAMLGGTYLSMTDIVHATPEEKFNQIRNAVRRAGVDFKSMNVHYKNAMAAHMGVDVNFAARLFGSEEDYKKASEGLRTSEIDQAKMTKRVESSLTVAETMKKSLSSLVGGMSKIVKKGRVVARDLSNQIGGSFENIRKQVGGSAKSVLAFMGALKAVELTGMKLRKAKGLVKVGGVVLTAGLAAVAANLKRVPGVGPDLFYALEEQLGLDLDDPPDGQIGAPTKTKKKTTGSPPTPAGGAQGASTKFIRDKANNFEVLGKSVESLAAALEKQSDQGTPVVITLVPPEDFRTASMKFEGALNAINGQLVKAFEYNADTA